jgi:hypothetical protein
MRWNALSMVSNLLNMNTYYCTLVVEYGSLRFLNSISVCFFEIIPLPFIRLLIANLALPSFFH